jgi:elongation factor G
MMGVSAVTPEDFAGAVASDLCARRGRITGMERRGTAQEVRAMVPLANMFGYATQLRNLTQGRATFTMHFEHYEPVPFAIAEEIIAERRKQAEKR